MSSSRKIRINKFLVEAGVAASRRQAEELLETAKCKIKNAKFGNVPADKIRGYQVDPDEDKVYVNGRLVRWQEREKIYLMMNKPVGYVCTRQDPHAKKTVYDLLPSKYRGTGLFTVGRLDKDSEGLLLLTNDGDWANHLMHPRYQSEKEYLVWTKRQLSLQHLGDLKAGVKIDGKTLRMKGIKLHDQSDNIYQIILTEGHKRQIRVMIEHVGNEVVRLQRFREDQYRLGDLPPGQVREIKI